MRDFTLSTPRCRKIMSPGQMLRTMLRPMLPAMLLFMKLFMLLTSPGVNADSATIQKIEAQLDKPKVLCGSFEQSKQLQGFKKPLVSRGRFCVQAGKGILWRTLQPFPATLRLTPDAITQFQGERVAFKLEAKQEPTVRLINSVLFSVLAGDLQQLDKLFEIHARFETKADVKPDPKVPTQWLVTLTSREPALAKAIGNISLGGSRHVQHITLSEASGDHTGIRFSQIQTGDAAMQPEEVALYQ